MCNKLELIHQQQLDTVHYNFRQSARGRKKVAVSRSRVSRERDTLRKQLEHQMKLANKLKMRYSRRQRKLKTPQTTSNTPSPRTNTRRLLRCLGGNPSKLQKVKKTLDFLYSLLKDLKNRLAESKDEKERQVIARFFTGSLVMKYKLRNLAKCTTGLSQRRVYGSSFQQKCQTRVYNSEKKKEAHEFYLRDDVSRMTTGIKNTVTKAQVKKQRRILPQTKNTDG